MVPPFNTGVARKGIMPDHQQLGRRGRLTPVPSLQPSMRIRTGRFSKFDGVGDKWRAG